MDGCTSAEQVLYTHTYAACALHLLRLQRLGPVLEPGLLVR